MKPGEVRRLDRMVAINACRVWEGICMKLAVIVGYWSWYEMASCARTSILGMEEVLLNSGLLEAAVRHMSSGFWRDSERRVWRLWILKVEGICCIWAMNLREIGKKFYWDSERSNLSRIDYLFAMNYGWVLKLSCKKCDRSNLLQRCREGVAVRYFPTKCHDARRATFSTIGAAWILFSHVSSSVVWVWNKSAKYSQWFGPETAISAYSSQCGTPRNTYLTRPD